MLWISFWDRHKARTHFSWNQDIPHRSPPHFLDHFFSFALVCCQLSTVPLPLLQPSVPCTTTGLLLSLPIIVCATIRGLTLPKFVSRKKSTFSLDFSLAATSSHASDYPPLLSCSPSSCHWHYSLPHTRGYRLRMVAPSSMAEATPASLARSGNIMINFQSSDHFGQSPRRCVTLRGFDCQWMGFRFGPILLSVLLSIFAVIVIIVSQLQRVQTRFGKFKLKLTRSTWYMTRGFTTNLICPIFVHFLSVLCDWVPLCTPYAFSPNLTCLR